MLMTHLLPRTVDLAGSDEWRKAEADMLVHFIEDIYSKGYRDLVVSHLQNNVEGKVSVEKNIHEKSCVVIFMFTGKSMGSVKRYHSKGLV